MNNRRLINSAGLLVAGLLLAACSRDSAEDPPRAEATAEAPRESALLPRTASPEGARVFFIIPADGEIVSNPVSIEFGIEGMSVVKAGILAAQSGHHHLIVDAGLPDMALPIPANDHYIHFGDASEDTVLTLEPGDHTLKLLLGDYLHIPHEPPVVSATITITVE